MVSFASVRARKATRYCPEGCSLWRFLASRPATYILSMPTLESIKALLSLKESALALVAHDFPDRLLRYARVHRYTTRERIALLSVRLADKGRAPDLMFH